MDEDSLLSVFPEYRFQKSRELPSGRFFLAPRKLPFPGPFEEFDKESRGVLHFEKSGGIQFQLHRIIHPMFQVAHVISFGDKEHPAKYAFSAHTSTQKGGAMLQAFQDSEGLTNGRGMLKLSDRLVLSLTGQAIPEANMSQAELDYRGPDFSTQFKFAPHMFGASYMQSVTDKLSFGADLAVMKQPQPFTALQAVFRYASKTSIVAGLIAPAAAKLSVSYTQLVHDTLHFSSDFQVRPDSENTGIESVVTAGFVYNLPRNVLKGRINSLGVLSGSFEERLGTVMNFGINVELDHANEEYSCGVTLQLQY